MRSVIFSLLCFALVAIVAAGDVRFGNLLSDEDNVVSLTVDGKLVLSSSKYTEFSGYIPWTNGDYNVTVWNFKNESIISSILTVKDGFNSFVAFSGSPKKLIAYQDSFSHPDIANFKTQLRLLHGVPNGVGVDVSVNNNQVVTNLTWTQATGYLTLDQGIAVVEIFLAGQNISLAKFNLTLFRGQVYTAIAVNGVPIQALLVTDQNYQRASVRVQHASPDAPAVVIYVGATSYNSLAFTQQSAYQDVLPNKTQTINVTVGGVSVGSLNATFLPLTRYTVLVYGFNTPPAGNNNGLSIFVMLDPPVDPNTSRVRFGNLVPDSTYFWVSFDGKNTSLSYGPKNFTAGTSVSPGNYDVIVYNVTGYMRSRRFFRRQLGDVTPVLKTTLTLNAGVLYTVFIEGRGGNIQIVADGQPSPNNDNGSSGLSGGAIAGIVIGTVFGAILIVGLIVYLYRRSKYQSIP